MDKKNSRPPETTAPLGNIGSCHFCPHWNTAGHLCLLSQDGLFLPVQEHVADFCECSDYPRCPRFRAHADRVTRAVNRRRSVRLPERHLFRFSEISSTGPMSGATADEAWTLDLSDHGLRVATTCQLRPETAINFEVTGNGTLSLYEGIPLIVAADLADGYQTLKYKALQKPLRMRAVYTPGVGDTGGSLLDNFESTGGLLILLH